MSTCLDDLNVTLNAILTALDGNGGEEAPSISITTKAAADASAVANAFALTNVQLQAVAVATANAIAMVDVDISLTLEQTTTVVNQVLPPVSILVPPDITVFPEVETGVSDTPRTVSTPGGNICQAIYEVIDNIQAFVTTMAKYPIWGLDTTYDLLTAVLGAVGALEFFLSLGIPIYEVYGMSECTGPTTLKSSPREAALNSAAPSPPTTTSARPLASTTNEEAPPGVPISSTSKPSCRK